VEYSSTGRYAESFRKAGTINSTFRAGGELPPVRLTWYDGSLKPPRPDDLEDTRRLNDEGLLFIGDRGTILCGFNGRRPQLIPEARMKAYQEPPKTLPRSPGNDREWLDACRGSQTKPGANFEFSGVVTEALLLGNGALRTGQRLLWDGANLKASNVPTAEAYIRPPARAGWAL